SLGGYNSKDVEEIDNPCENPTTSIVERPMCVTYQFERALVDGVVVAEADSSTSNTSNPGMLDEAISFTIPRITPIKDVPAVTPKISEVVVDFGTRQETRATYQTCSAGVPVWELACD
ncbi:hypothetical protein, partial [Lysobacter sp. A3-1-A15]